MSLGKELKEVNATKIGEIFNELIGAPLRPNETELDNFFFMQEEIARSDAEYPLFPELMSRFKGMIPDLLAAGEPEDKIKGVMMGMYVTQVVLSSYAAVETPDTLMEE